MQRLVNAVGPLRRIAWARATRRFLAEQAEQGVYLADRDAPLLADRAHTLLIDASLLMEGWNAVRMAAAPLAVCPIDRYRRQGSWMMLTAGVSLGSAGYGPLENFAREMNFECARMARQYPEVRKIAFTDERLIETTVHRDAGGFRAFTKGLPEAILSCCSHVLDGKERPMDDSDMRQAYRSAMEMEKYGLEAIAFATKALQSEGDADAERGMTFLGIVGMGDLPNEHTPREMQRLRALGKRPVFVSKTAFPESAVQASGVLRAGSGVLYGSELSELSADELSSAGLWADAFVGVDNGLRRRLAWAIRRREPAAIITRMPDGEVTLSTGKNGVEDAVLRMGGLHEVVVFLERCRKLCEGFT